jgi:hypothetical protein
VEFAKELEATLREFSEAGPAELRENGARIAPLSSLTWEIRGTSERPLLHFWSEDHNLTRRVLAITDHSEKRLALAVERFGFTKPARLEFLRLEYERAARDLDREAFCHRLNAICAEQFPDDTLESLTMAPDLEHSLSGNYARGVLRKGKLRWALLAMPPEGPSEQGFHSLTFALLWLDYVRRLNRGEQVAGLRMILPKGAAASVARMLPAIDSRLPVILYEMDETLNALDRIDPQALTNLDSWLVPARETQMLLERARPALEQVLSPGSPMIALHPIVPAREVWLRFRGVAFARWKDGRIYFGIPDQDQELTPRSRPALEKLLRELETARHPLASDTRHPLYRAQPERWLESLVQEDPTRIDAALDPRFLYAQVLANVAGEHGILDLLGVTRAGRLAILELKANEHIHFPLQAAGYWLRIRRHLEQGDLQRYGYFPGIELGKEPPAVYLVAPALRMHPTTDALLRYFSPELEVIRVGFAESWRRGLSVVLRQ